MLLGAYLGEVVRRAYGGKWQFNDELQETGLLLGTQWISPPAKAMKRLYNGDEDNPWFYFQVIISNNFSGADSSAQRQS